MEETSITITLPADIVRELQFFSGTLARPPDGLIADALVAWLEQGIARGIDDLLTAHVEAKMAVAVAIAGRDPDPVLERLKERLRRMEDVIVRLKIHRDRLRRIASVKHADALLGNLEETTAAFLEFCESKT